MTPEEAKSVLRAGARCAAATESFFDAFSQLAQNTLEDSDAVAVVTEYCDAKEAFDRAVMTRGMVST